ncbi:T-cell activation Rho GTPase-activating protein-like [Buteo buteo]|uniref:T-cell activation Rho GTPase-activating protein-like n=1 Tax=Buteo buteo TaxID=30397 RepID=UPI003EBDE504
MGQANCCCGSREALTDAEPVLSTDVRLTRGRKRSERRLLLLQEELVIAKLHRGTSLRPQLRLALDQLWVLSGGKEAAGDEEEEEGGDEDGTSILLVWPSGSCVATFPSRALKELWVGTLLGTPEGAKRARGTAVPSVRLLEKELGRRHARRTFSAGSLERMVEGQAELARLSFAAGGSSSSRRRKRRGLPWPFARRRTPAAAQAPGQAGSGCSRALFGQPLAALCGEDGSLPRPIQELLAVLRREGPSTEGIFRRAAGGTELRELREALDRGARVDLGSQPALLLAAVLKDFLRSIPDKLLVNSLYEDWMQAMERTGKEEKLCELKAVAEKLPAANLLLLERLLSLLQHVGHNAATSRMTASNLAICLGPNLLSPPDEDLLPLQAMLEVTEKVNTLVEFMIENCGDIVGEEVAGRSPPSAGESPAPTDGATELPLEEQSGPAGRADQGHQAEAILHASPSLDVLKGAGGDTVAQSQTTEAPPALPAATLESTAEPLLRPQQLGSLSEERRFAGSPRDEEKRRNRRRTQAWGDEGCAENKRRKREKGSGDRKRKRCRKVRQVRKPRCRFPGTG